jgi:hypothetical protein
MNVTQKVRQRGVIGEQEELDKNVLEGADQQEQICDLC